MTEELLYKYIRQIAGGTHAAPRTIRDCAIRVLTHYNDDEDLRIVTEYLESLYDE